MKWAVIAKVLKFYLRFTLSFTRIGYYGRRLFFDKSTASFAGKTVLVTGASGVAGEIHPLQCWVELLRHLQSSQVRFSKLIVQHEMFHPDLLMGQKWFLFSNWKRIAFT